MNQPTNDILSKIFKKCNLPDGLIDSTSVSITEKGFASYYATDVRQRHECHHELEFIASQAPGFDLIFKPAGFEGARMLDRIAVKNTRALLMHCRQPILSDDIGKSIQELYSLDLDAPGAADILNTIKESWIAGKLAFGCSYHDVLIMNDCLRLYEWHFHQPDDFMTDIRTASSWLFKDSKRIEKIMAIAANLFRFKSPETLKSFKPDEVLAYWGISRFPTDFPFRADITLRTNSGLLDAKHGRPYVSLPGDSILEVANNTIPEYVLFIENKTPFQRYTREIVDTGWVFYTNGFPSRQWQRIFKMIIDGLPREVPVFHWGDADVGGYSILVFLSNLLGGRVIPHQMIPSTESESGPAIDAKQLLSELRKDLHSSLGSLESQIVDMHQQNTKLYRLEQESLPLANPLSGLYAANISSPPL